MRNIVAYFAGVGTVFAATAIGFGGALMFTGGPAPRSELTKMEQRGGAAPSPALASEAKPAADQTSVANNTPAPQNVTTAPPQPPQPAVPSVQQTTTP